MNENETMTATTKPTQEQVTAAMGLLATALQALRKLGLLTDTPTAATAEAAAVAAPETVVAAPSSSAWVPRRGKGGRFLKRDGSAGETPAAAPKATKPPKPAKPQPKFPAPDTVDAFVAWFFTTPQEHLYSCKCGQYEVRTGSEAANIAHVLLFHSTVSKERHERDRDGKLITVKDRVEPKDGNNIIGIRPFGTPLGVFNANRLLYGNFLAEQLRPQVAAEKAGAIPVPFENVVAKSGGAGLDLSKLQIVNWAGAEDMVIPPVKRGKQWKGKFFVIKRHFAGALVLKVEDKYFLFDTDREELSHCGFNPFFTQLPGPASTIEEAYDLLLPEEARQARAAGVEVLRQGEFFFIKQTEAAMWNVVNKTGGQGATPRAFRRLTEDFRDVGDSHYMWMAVERANEIQDFMARCANGCGGFLPAGMLDTAFPTDEEGDITGVEKSDVNAETVLKPLVAKYMDFSQLSEGALAVVDGENVVDRTIREYRAGKQPTIKGLKALIEELATPWKPSAGVNGRFQVRQTTGPLSRTSHLRDVAEDLVDRCAAASTGGVPGPVKPGAELSRMFNVYFGVQLGKDGDTSTTNAHIATGTMLTADGIYAIGAVTHSGREHRPLHLPGWYKVVSNTATANWTVEP